MKSPVIGITCNALPLVSESVSGGIGVPSQSWQLLAEDYLRMIEKAGGIPLILPISDNPQQTLPLWQKLDGLLLSGGNDVDPLLYQERITAKCGSLDTARDNYEVSAAKFAVANHLPILGICRGIQILNIALGGTLYQDLPSSGFELHCILAKKRNQGSHYIKITENSLLANILGTTKVLVNSFHHQAVRSPSSQLEVIAVSEDGVIEAVTKPGPTFTLAVQWHPEMMYDNAQQQKIAAAFIKACAQ